MERELRRIPANKDAAAASPEDAGREKYLAGKQAFVRETLQKAAEWVRLGRPAPAAD